MAQLQELAPGPGAITDGPFGSKLTSAHYSASGARVIRLQNIGDGVFKPADAFIPAEHYESLRKHEVRSGDLLIASLGDDPPRACLTPEGLGPAIVKADCIRVRLGDDVEPRWVLYALQLPRTKRWSAEQMHGVGRLRLGLKNIRSIPVPLASLDEQRRIADLLDDHLSRLDAADAYIANSSRRTAAFRQHAIGRVTSPLGSTNVSLGSLIDRVEAGRSFGGAAAPARLDEWGVIKVSAMTWGAFNGDQNKAVTESAVDGRNEIRAGDVLVSRANTTDYVGAPVLVRDTRPRLLLSDKSLRLVPRDDVDRQWLVDVLSAPNSRRQISAAATGTSDSMRNISQRNLLAIEVSWVPPAEQVRISEECSQIRAAASGLQESIDRARTRSRLLRRALLEAAFTGRLTGKSIDQEIIEELAAVPV